MNSGSDKQQITTQTSDPWPAAQPYIASGLKNANNVFNAGKATPKPWQSNLLAPLNKYSQHALQGTMGLAHQGVQGLPEAQNFAKGMISSNGMTPELEGVASGIRSGMDEASGYLRPFASGEYNEDPRLLAMIDRERNNATNAAATKFGGGRYGSAAIGQGMSQAQTAATDGLMLQSNENSRNRQLQASGQLGSLQMQGGGLLGNLYEGGLNRAFQATSALPMLDELSYSPYQRMAAVGDVYQDRAQKERDGTINRFYETQGRPAAGAEWYNAMMNGAGSLGGTKTTMTPNQKTSPLLSAAGGALTGAKLGSFAGPWGTGIGAIGGGLLGAFS